MKVEGISQTQPITQLSQQFKPEGRVVPVKPAGDDVKNAKNQPEETEKDLKSIPQAVDLLNRTMEGYNAEIKFALHEKSGEYFVKVINTNDNTVIREIPSEKVLNMVAYFKEVLGLIVDKFI